MKKQSKVVFFLMMIIFQQASLFTIDNSDVHQRILESKKKKKSRRSKKLKQKTKNSNKSLVNDAKPLERKLYMDDYSTHIGSASDYIGSGVNDKLTAFITMALGGMVIYNSFAGQKPERRNRKLKEIKTNASKVIKKMKGKSVVQFIRNEEKDIAKFMKKSQRKLQGGSSMSSIIKLGEQYLARQLGIDQSLISMISPLASNMFGSFGSQSVSVGPIPKLKHKKTMKKKKVMKKSAKAKKLKQSKRNKSKNRSI